MHTRHRLYLTCVAGLSFFCPVDLAPADGLPRSHLYPLEEPTHPASEVSRTVWKMDPMHVYSGRPGVEYALTIVTPDSSIDYQ